MAQTEAERLLSEIADLYKRKEEFGEEAYTEELERLAQALSENYQKSLALQPGEGRAALEKARDLLKSLSKPPI